MDDLFDWLQEEIVFSKIHWEFGNHQLRIKPENIPKIIFRIRRGHYNFTMMLFGKTNALTAFTDLMNIVFRPYLNKFMDDILIYSKDKDEHIAY